MTLIEIMIVVVIMGMLAAAAGIAVMRAKGNADEKLARSDVHSLAQVAEAYQLTMGLGCPSLEQLKESKLLRRGSKTEDPWGTPYEVTCDTGEVNVRSAGRDMEHGTADDIALF